MTKQTEAMELAQEWQQTNWNTENPMSADFAVSEANDVIDSLIDALREARAEQPAQSKPLTDQQIEQIFKENAGYSGNDFISFARAIESLARTYK